VEFVDDVVKREACCAIFNKGCNPANNVVWPMLFKESLDEDV
jgi:hypothetical protein